MLARLGLKVKVVGQRSRSNANKLPLHFVRPMEWLILGCVFVSNRVAFAIKSLKQHSITFNSNTFSSFEKVVLSQEDRFTTIAYSS